MERVLKVKPQARVTAQVGWHRNRPTNNCDTLTAAPPRVIYDDEQAEDNRRHVRPETTA